MEKASFVGVRSFLASSVWTTSTWPLVTSCCSVWGISLLFFQTESGWDWTGSSLTSLTRRKKDDSPQHFSLMANNGQNFPHISTNSNIVWWLRKSRHSHEGGFHHHSHRRSQSSFQLFTHFVNINLSFYLHFYAYSSCVLRDKNFLEDKSIIYLSKFFHRSIHHLSICLSLSPIRLIYGGERSDLVPSRLLTSNRQQTCGPGRSPGPRGLCSTRTTNTPRRSGAGRIALQTEGSWNQPVDDEVVLNTWNKILRLQQWSETTRLVLKFNWMSGVHLTRRLDLQLPSSIFIKVQNSQPNVPRQRNPSEWEFQSRFSCG